MMRLVFIAVAALCIIVIVLIVSKFVKWADKVTDEEARKAFNHSLEELEQLKKNKKEGELK